MADRIVVMRAGQVEQIGPPLDLYDKPQNAFVAGFIGSPAMNLIAGAAMSAAGVPVVEGVLYGIRPEHLDLVPLGTEGAIGGRVTALESTGTATFAAVQTAGFTLNALFPDRPNFARGDQITLRPRPGLTHLFDAETLLRLP